MGTKSDLLGNVKSSNHFTNTSTFFKTQLMYNMSTITTLNFWFPPFGNMVQRKVANPTDITRVEEYFCLVLGQLLVDSRGVQTCGLSAKLSETKSTMTCAGPKCNKKKNLNEFGLCKDCKESLQKKKLQKMCMKNLIIIWMKSTTFTGNSKVVTMSTPEL